MEKRELPGILLSGSGIQLPTKEITDSSIYFNLLIDINLTPRDTLLDVFQNNQIPIREGIQSLYASIPDYPHPYNMLLELNLPGFTTGAWRAFSLSRYAIEASSFKTSLFDTLLRMLLQRKEGMGRRVTILGDYSEIRNVLTVLNSPKFQAADLILNWTGFCPDPHTVYDSNFKASLISPELDLASEALNSLKMSQSFPEYDSYLGSKWYTGIDGSGLLNNQNLAWLSTQDSLKADFIIAVLDRPDYFDDSEPIVALYYRVCLAVLISCLPGGSAIIKLSLPVNRAILGIYSLLCLYFGQVRILKFKQQPLDDDTVYILASKKQEISVHQLVVLFQNRDLVLDYLGRQTKPLHIDLNRVYLNGLEEWLADLRNAWHTRNN